MPADRIFCLVRPLPLVAGAAALLLAAARGDAPNALPRGRLRRSGRSPRRLVSTPAIGRRSRTTISSRPTLSVQAGLDASPGDYALRKYRLRLLLPHHDFETLAREAAALKAERPDDAELDGALGDAAFDLGRYDEARAAWERFASRQPSTASYSRVALLRDVTGDLKSALAFMDLAAAAALPADPEAFAWCRSRAAKLLLKMNRYDEAEGRLAEALQRVKDHAPSLAVAAEIAARKGLWEPAIRLAERSLALSPDVAVAAALVGLPRGDRRRRRRGARAGASWPTSTRACRRTTGSSIARSHSTSRTTARRPGPSR